MNRRGFMLIEILVALALLGVFALLATALFRGSMRATSEAPMRQDQMTRVAGLLDRIRDDAWRAGAMTVSGERTLVLDGGSDAEIRWEQPEHGVVTRSAAGEEPMRWQAVPGGLRFERRGSLTLARLDDGDEIVLQNFLELANRP